MVRDAEMLVFEVEGQACGLPLEQVERIEPAVAINPLMNAPSGVAGLINFHGEVIPVLDARFRFQLPAREVKLGDHFIIAQVRSRTVALWVEHIHGVERCSLGVPSSEASAEMSAPRSGVTTLDNRLITIQPMETFVSAADERCLAEMLEGVA